MKKRLIIIGFLASIILSTNVAFANFTDVDENHPNYNGISYLETIGAVSSGGKFRPDDFLNKAELFKILFASFGENGEGIIPSDSFSDVPKNAWFAPFIELGIKNDLIVIKTDTFHPEGRISRANALKYILKAYGIPTPIIPKSEREQIFNDVSTGNPNYSVIGKAVQMGIISSDLSGNFAPNSGIKRGEFADLVLAMDEWNKYVDALSPSDASGIIKQDILNDIWNRIVNNYYLPEGAEVDEELLFQSTVKGMINSLGDPYTIYVPPSGANNLISNLTGNFEGIGVYLLQDEASGKIFVTDFVPDSNAKEVGMKIGDVIDEVDGINVVNMSMEEVSNRIKGPAGTKVDIQVRREGNPVNFKIERRKLSIVSITSKIIENDLWYIDINSFTPDNFIEINDHFKTLENLIPEPRAIVIDLRGNGGGFMNSALSIAGHFIPNSRDLIQIDYGTSKATTANTGKGEYSKIPLYVLIDEYSASASEILASALSEQIGAKLVGKQSFGKGTAQQISQYWDGSILKMTIAQWLTSKGKTIQGIGLTPDIKVTQKSSTIDLWLNEVKNDLSKK